MKTTIKAQCQCDEETDRAIKGPTPVPPDISLVWVGRFLGYDLYMGDHAGIKGIHPKMRDVATKYLREFLNKPH